MLMAQDIWVLLMNKVKVMVSEHYIIMMDRLHIKANGLMAILMEREDFSIHIKFK
jgi:hypothetical protein